MIGYVVRREDREGDTYAGLAIDLYDLERDILRQAEITLHWQGNLQGEDYGWYAGRISVRARNTTELATAWRLLRWLRLGEIGGDELRLDDVLDRLAGRRNVSRVVYDARLGRHVTPEEIIPGGRYMDDYHHSGYPEAERHCHVAVVAESETEARARLAMQYAGYAHDPHYRELYALWVQHGCRVMITDGAEHPPRVPDMAVLLYLPTEQ